MSPETGIEHLRNVLQALAQPTHTVEPFVLLLTPMEVAAMRVRIKAALRELESYTPTDGSLTYAEWQAQRQQFTSKPRTSEYVVDVVQGARMDGASLGGQEPEHPTSETCPCEACLAAHGTYKPGHSGGLAF